jgi:uncharacterized protein (TIGR02996 family)
MNVRDALLQDILEHPDDDLPRLVYADWLEEHGDAARAEFIRVQLVLAGMDDGDPDGDDLRRRERALLDEHQEEWTDELPALPGTVTWGEFRRGFVDGVRAESGEALRAVAGPILAVIPLRRLTLLSWNAEESLAGSALLAQVRELVLTLAYRPPDDDRLQDDILAWPELRQMTHLVLDWPLISSAGVEALAAADMPGLTSLTWRALERAPYNLEPVCSATWLPRLASLNLEQQVLSGAVFRELSAHLTPGRLRRLALCRASLTDADAAALAESGLPAGLEVLDLSYNRIGPAGTRELIRVLPGTARLLLDNNPIGDEGLQALARSPLFARLGGLPGWMDFSAAGARAVAASPYAGRLRHLNLPGKQIDTGVAEVLLTSPHLAALTWLNLTGNRIEKLTACQYERLECLTLESNRLGP